MSKLALFSLLLSLALLMLPKWGLSQISHGGTPASFGLSLGTERIPELLMPAVDLKALILEDQQRDADKLPYRFGYEFEVDLSLKNAGHWIKLPNGDRLWRLKLSSPQALSISLIYEEFYLPKGGSLFLYSPDKQHVLGAFTSENNKAYRKFSTSLLPGQSSILEYYEPADVKGQGIIHVSKVIHAYRGMGLSASRGFGDAGACNNNINCPEGLDWQTESRAVALIIEGGFRACTGAMINTVRDDCTPYLLTANHCLSSDVNTWMFMFNYDSPTCQSMNGPTNMTVSGAILRSNGISSDFALIELSTPPPPSYQVFHAGFSAVDLPADSSVGIHHPAGDVKKISFDYDTALHDFWFAGVPNTHWTVSEWEDGTTEPGSSGSPLFDQNHRIVGQLHGGDALCSAQDEYDSYGKLAYSWNRQSHPSQQLQFWLDPDHTGIDLMNGKECALSPSATDLAVVQILSPWDAIVHCQDSLEVEVLLRNLGVPVDSFEIQYRWDTNAWTSLPVQESLLYMEAGSLSIPTTALSIGPHLLELLITKVNGSSDMNASNDSLQIRMTVIDGQEFSVRLSTDNFPRESSFEIRDSTDQLLYSIVGFDLQNHTYDLGYCLDPGCYTLILKDAVGDGIAANPAVDILDRDGTQIGTASGNFGAEVSIPFCIPYWEPVADFSLSKDSICSGEYVRFTSTSQYADNISWAFPGGIPGTSSDSVVEVVYQTPGSYDVQISAAGPGGLDNAIENEIIQVWASPNLSIFPSNASSHFLSDGSVKVSATAGLEPYTYIWSTGQVTSDSGLLGLSPGTYSVAVQDANGCLRTEAFAIGPALGLDDLIEAPQITIFPNPGAGLFTIEKTGNQSLLHVQLVNPLGEFVLGPFSIDEGISSRTIDLSQKADGLYLIQVRSEDAIQWYKVLKQ
ncbi:MAG: trypsin-like peptidase domain-containing protein [Bacteroidota bacterium]